MKKVLIADDHAIVRQGLKQVLSEAFPEIEFAEAVNGNEALEKARANKWDALILDLSMEGRPGLEILKQLKTENNPVPVLILSMHPEDQYAVRVLKAGAYGYLTKDTDMEELVLALRRILEGRKYISLNLAEKLANDLEKDLNKPAMELMSDREYQVFCLLASGKTVGQVAEELCLSVNTISTYRSRVLEKMNMKNNAQLTHFAMEQGLINPI